MGFPAWRYCPRCTLLSYLYPARIPRVFHSSMEVLPKVYSTIIFISCSSSKSVPFYLISVFSPRDDVAKWQPILWAFSGHMPPGLVDSPMLYLKQKVFFLGLNITVVWPLACKISFGLCGHLIRCLPIFHFNFGKRGPLMESIQKLFFWWMWQRWSGGCKKRSWHHWGAVRGPTILLSHGEEAAMWWTLDLVSKPKMHVL